jgi:CHAD domain-containing protein
MTAEIQRHAADARTVHRILCDHLDAAADTLEARPISDEAIHTARKSLKKARAVLRLLKDAIPHAQFRRENLALRDAARPLSAARDARALIDSLEKLEKLYGPAARQAIPPAFRRALESEQRATRRKSLPATRSPTHPVVRLQAIRKRVTVLRISAHGWEEIGTAFKRTYRNGRGAMKFARRTPTPECLHEWRKQSKHLWHQLQVLEPMSPGVIGELADQAHRLADYLGDHHDLAVLREQVTSHENRFAKPGGSGALLALIDRCEERLQEKAFLLGKRVYDEKPTAILKRFTGYRKRWRSSSAAAS